MNGSFVGNLQTTQKRSCYVKAVFEYDPAKDSGIPGKGLSFKYGDILHVINASDDDWWQARKVFGERLDQGVGIIPSKKRIEKKEKSRMRSVQFKGGHSESTAQLLKDKKKRHIFPRKFNFSKTKEKSKSENTLIEPKKEKLTQATDDVSIVSYEPVIKTQIPYSQPVIILGPLKDRICDELINLMPNLFETCIPHTTRQRKEDEEDGRDYHFISNRNLMQSQIQANLFIEAGEFNGNLYGTSVQAVKEVAYKHKHCLLDVSGNAIKKLQQNNLFPISILVKPRTIDALFDWIGKITPEQARGISEKTRQLENEFYSYFTAIIINDSIEEIIIKIKEIIKNYTNNNYSWLPSDEKL